MARNNNKMNGAKTNAKMDELVAIEKSPELTEYIIRTKIKDVRKTALIVGLISVGISFAGGLLLGLNITKLSVPQNVVEVRVDSNVAQPTDAEGK